jgi:hypothetical protein
MSDSEMVAGLYGGHYEAVLWGAFIEIARRYPGEVLQTLFYYKPRLILSTLGLELQTKMSVFPPLAIALLVAALGNMSIYSIGAADVAASNRRPVMAAGTLLFTASTIPPYLVAWANVMGVPPALPGWQ